MLAAQKEAQNICVRTLEGAIYTVDEVSDLLGIPRPTLYRYLREYSIPHVRRSGRISIPEDSFDRIREARDLHKEGLGTELVRRQLREGRGPDTGELDRRLDNLHETLEGLRGELRERPATDEVALSPTLRTILARQSLMISAMFNLTGMVEDLLLASGKRRRSRYEGSSMGLAEPLAEEQAGGRLAIPAAVPDAVPATAPVSTAEPDGGSPSLPARPTRFGALGRRRRRGVLAIASALLVGLCLAWAVPTLVGAGEDTESAWSAGGPPAGTPSGPEDRKAVAGEPTSPGETTAREGTGAEGSQAGADERVATVVPEPDAAIAVPDVSGRSIAEAAQVLSDAGLEVAYIRDESSQQEPETVIGTIPAAGTRAEPGAPMTLRVSVGTRATSPGTHSASAGASTSAASSASASVSANASASASVGASAGASSSASASAGYAY